MDLAERLGRARAGRARWCQPPERDLHLPDLQLSVLARLHEIGIPQIPDDRLRISEGSQRVDPLRRIAALIGFEHGVDLIPVPLEQVMNETEPGGEPRDASVRVSARVKWTATRRSLVRAKRPWVSSRTFGQLGSSAGLMASPTRCSGLPRAASSSSKNERSCSRFGPHGGASFVSDSRASRLSISLFCARSLLSDLGRSRR